MFESGVIEDRLQFSKLWEAIYRATFRISDAEALVGFLKLRHADPFGAYKLEPEG